MPATHTLSDATRALLSAFDAAKAIADAAEHACATAAWGDAGNWWDFYAARDAAAADCKRIGDIATEAVFADFGICRAA